MFLLHVLHVYCFSIVLSGLMGTVVCMNVSLCSCGRVFTGVCSKCSSPVCAMHSFRSPQRFWDVSLVSQPWVGMFLCDSCGENIEAARVSQVANIQESVFNIGRKRILAAGAGSSDMFAKALARVAVFHRLVDSNFEDGRFYLLSRVSQDKLYEAVWSDFDGSPGKAVARFLSSTGVPSSAFSTGSSVKQQGWVVYCKTSLTESDYAENLQTFALLVSVSGQVFKLSYWGSEPRRHITSASLERKSKSSWSTVYAANGDLERFLINALAGVFPSFF